MGLLRRLSSPVKTVDPLFTNEAIEVINLIVVPELSALITSSGARKSCPPFTFKILLSCLIKAPSALQDEIVARVSLEYKGFLIIDCPSAREDITNALWL
jgi:hypothetical protein